MPAAPPPWSRGRIAAVAVGLALLVGALYAPTLRYPLTDFDDPAYVSRNAVVREGLTPRGLGWAIGIGRAANWHPVTWFSHMLDVELFGLEEGRLVGTGGHHLTNVALHALNAALLFVLLVRVTGRPWPALFVAAVFGVHPVNVESVAWVAQRKGVLSTTFFLLTLLAYAGYARRGGRARYALVAGLYALGLAAKQMLVSLPLLLLLLDWWPLGRLTDRRRLVALVNEKLPLAGLAAVASVLVVLAQRAGEAISAEPAGVRLPNAVVSYVAYLGMLVWPAGLAHYYPLSAARWAWWEVGGSALFLLGLTAAAVRLRERWPMLAVGWAWYVIALVPVIGIVQVGAQARADRYLYLPMIGLLVAVAYAVPQLLAARWPGRAPGRIVAALAVAAVAALLPVTARQIGFWRDSETLYRRALAVTEGNWHAHAALAAVLFRRADALRTARQAEAARAAAGEAVEHARRAIALHPGMVAPRTNLGAALTVLARLERDPAAAGGLLAEAEAAYRAALALDADNALAHSNLATLLLDRGQAGSALPHFEAAVRADPDAAAIRFNYGLALARAGRPQEAAAEFRRALELRPGNAVAYWASVELAALLAAAGQRAEAEALLRQAARIDAQANVDPVRRTAERRLAALGGP